MNLALREMMNPCYYTESSLVRIYVQLHAYVPTHAIFSLGVRLSYTLFSITGFLGVGLSHAWKLLKTRSQGQKFVFISLVTKKVNSLISMFSQAWYMHGMERVKEDILSTFCGTADDSRMFLSFVGQRQHRLFYKCCFL